jgi:hypothetical protein
MTHLYGPIECCSLPIFSFLTVKELAYYYKNLGNKMIHLSILFLLNEYKCNNLYFTKIFSNQMTKQEIQTCPLLFLNHFKTLQNYLFSLFNKHESPHKILFFQNKLNRLFAIKQISDTMILFLMITNKESIYYTLLESQNSYELETFPKNKRHGYVYEDGNYTSKMNHLKELLETH